MSLVESEHVHKVYNQIAPHFSQTRYKPWPIVERFINQLPAGSLIADIGCGNGKNMLCTPTATRHVFIGCDYSAALVALCRQQQQQHLKSNVDVMVADNLCLPYRSSAFDNVISIAVIHHFSTEQRRVNAIRELLRILRRSNSKTDDGGKKGRLLIFVWAMEQSTGSRRRFSEQDVFVSWKDHSTAKSKQEQLDGHEQAPVYQRYYHVFIEGELERITRMAADMDNIPIRIVESGYDRDNWYCIIEKL